MTVFMNQVDVSRRWKVSERTLERWRWSGVGPKFVKIGGRVKYRPEDIEAYERDHLCQCTSDEHYFDHPRAA